MEILELNGYRVINLTDGDLLSNAIELVESNVADGINLNFTRNIPATIEQIKECKQIRFLAINDYDHKKPYNYSAINTLNSLEHLSVYTTDKMLIDYSAFPKLKSTAIMWRPKAKSLFERTDFQGLFLGRFNGADLLPLFKLSELSYLRLNTGSLVSLTGISAFRKLEELHLMQLPKLEDVSEIQKLHNLNLLRVLNCARVKNIDLVKRLSLPNLEIIGTTPN